ncbi:MAG: type III glutamate--ammonia ligase [Rhodospirillaceae bacterium]|jgi:glutamine synthetase|nr:type III glutamate--ammonia ligase [Rhodospirillaceae bacterium]MBT6119817.1 type III glutamate--ammonia ligase [Rhodospirillaceae bacterium]
MASLDEIKRDLIDKGVRHCLASYTDMHGISKAKAVPIEHFERMIRGSELFTGAALDGLGQGPHDDELSVHPDPNAVVQLPWRPTVAWAPGRLMYHNEPWPMCSRNVLQRQIDRAAKLGLRFNLGIECEIFLVTREGNKVKPSNPLDVLPKAAYDAIGLLENIDWLDEVVGHMNHLGWEVHSFDHEDANSQFEFDFAYSDVMTMADRYTLFRMMMKECARAYGWEATFMPKPYADRTGSGAHFNMSFESLETGENVMGDESDPRGCGLSKLGYHFLGGVLKHAPAVVAVTCPIVNSYKRLIKTGSMTGFTWAPIFVSYGGNNRTHMLRVPMTRPEIEGEESKKAKHEGVYLSSRRVECRAVDPAMNVYLAAAMMLAAGLEGIENEIDPGDPRKENMYLLSQEELDERGVTVLPRTLLEATEAFDADDLGREVMGADLARSWVELKQREWWDYHNTVSAWELDHYLTRF